MLLTSTRPSQQYLHWNLTKHLGTIASHANTFIPHTWPTLLSYVKDLPLTSKRTKFSVLSHFSCHTLDKSALFQSFFAHWLIPEIFKPQMMIIRLVMFTVKYVNVRERQSQRMLRPSFYIHGLCAYRGLVYRIKYLCTLSPTSWKCCEPRESGDSMVASVIRSQGPDTYLATYQLGDFQKINYSF